MPIGIPIVKQAANDYLSPNFAHTFQNTDFLKKFARISVLNGLAVPRVFRQPEFLKTMLVGISAAPILMTILCQAGFGPGGIVLGSYAASFQSALYGGATPAGGIFATLQAMGMTGICFHSATIVSAMAAAVAGGVARSTGRL